MTQSTKAAGIISWKKGEPRAREGHKSDTVLICEGASIRGFELLTTVNTDVGQASKCFTNNISFKSNNSVRWVLLLFTFYR